MLPPTATDSIMKRRFFHLCVCVCVCVCVCMDEWLLCPWGSPRKNTRADCHALLQGIVPTPGRNPGLPHCRQILHQLSQQGSPRILEWVACPFSRGSSRSSHRTGVSCVADSLPAELPGKPMLSQIDSLYLKPYTVFLFFNSISTAILEVKSAN